LTIILFSCDKEDDSSLLFLEGSYESIMLSDFDEPIFTSVMTFNKSGKVLIEDFSYGINSGEACLVSFREETY